MPIEISCHTCFINFKVVVAFAFGSRDQLYELDKMKGNKITVKKLDILFQGWILDIPTKDTLPAELKWTIYFLLLSSNCLAL